MVTKIKSLNKNPVEWRSKWDANSFPRTPDFTAVM